MRSHIQPCQSGYVRGVEDAHLLLREISAEAIAQQRALSTSCSTIPWSSGTAKSPRIKAFLKVAHSGHLVTLVRELLAHNCGLGVGWVIPDVWKGRLWSGLGQPEPALVSLLKSALPCARPALNALLPSPKRVTWLLQMVPAEKLGHSCKLGV